MGWSKKTLNSECILIWDGLSQVVYRQSLAGRWELEWKEPSTASVPTGIQLCWRRKPAVLCSMLPCCSKRSGLPHGPISNLQTSSVSQGKRWNIAAENCSGSYLQWNHLLFLRWKKPPPLVSQGLCVCTPNPNQRGCATASFETLAHFSLMKSLHQWSV